MAVKVDIPATHQVMANVVQLANEPVKPEKVHVPKMVYTVFPVVLGWLLKEV
jgi:hypothetical protein